ncbi:leucine-rich repeat protein [Artemisia annua]|uniref:Leucine-rich repeat protein n=1 Tax=Artemisia annua TaxID=35608 RepID=A0A2U1LB77_ARTAN|nr:leucine-rich repeat protein [Artemisia annua]
MGNSRWGLGIHLIFISILSVSILTDNCLGARNLTATCYKQERLALVNFKNSVKDDHGMLSSWVGNNCCQWESVTCDADTGTIVSLHLRSKVSEPFYGLDDELLGEDYYLSSNAINVFVEKHQLAGDKINSGLAELKHLKYLDLSGNDFLGSRIPEFLGSFKKLSYLNLSNAGFIGNIPHHIGNLSNLKVLDLSRSDQVMVDNMAWVSGLSSLEHLNLNGVDLSRAQNLDKLLYIIPSLLKLRLAGCGLSNAQLGPYLNSTTKFANLKHLDLSRNNIEGQLPAFLQNMTSLVFLDLSASSNLSLILNSANLISMFPSLSELRLSMCEIQNVDLSPTHLNFSTRSNIQHLDLSKNQIEGRFPSVLSNMTSLLSLDLSSNDLNSSILVMPNLLKLDLSYNKFKHVGIWRQCHLKELVVSYNDLNEELVGSSTNVSECSLYALERLNLSGNYLKVSIGQLTKLSLLDVSNNSLQGAVSEAHFANLSALKFLNTAYNNKLTFNVSREWIPPFQLRTAKLGSCNISNKFPQWFRTQHKLEELFLSNASISGPLPSWLRHLPFVRVLDLSQNELTGTLTNLPHGNGYGYGDGGIVLVQDNLFKGSIPRYEPSTSVYSDENGMQVIEGIDLEDGGDVMQAIKGVDLKYAKTLKLVITMDLSSNKLVGEIPKDLYALSVLVGLNLSNNNLSGPIPKGIGNMTSLFSLDFSANELTGPIPPSISALNFLSHLNLSHNSLLGRIPTGNQLQTLTDPSIYAGNIDLCGAPLPKNCYEDPTSNNRYEDANKPKKVWFYLDIMSGFATGFWGIIGVLMFKKQWRHKLFMFSEATIDKIHVAIAVRISKMKRGRIGA